MVVKSKKKIKRKKSHFETATRVALQLVLFFTATVAVFTKPLVASDQLDPLMLKNDAATMQEYRFIYDIAPLAQKEQASTGLLSSLTLAQACLESDFGRSTLASKYKNLFGVKAYDASQPQVALNTKEFVNSKWITIVGNFRVYSSWEESIQSHTRLFQQGVDWDPGKYQNLFTAKDYKEAAQEVQQDGYATDPSYTDKLVKLIEAYQLNDYDQLK